MQELQGIGKRLYYADFDKFIVREFIFIYLVWKLRGWAIIIIILVYML